MASLKDKTILVVDNDEVQRETLREGFEMAGGIVQVFSSGLSAVEFLKTTKVDVLIADYRMLGGEELSILRSIDAKTRNQLLIFVYTAASDYSLEEFKKMGVVETFHLPVPTEKVIKSISDAVLAKAAASGSLTQSSFLEKVNFLILEENISQIESVSSMLSSEFPNANIIGALNPKDALIKIAKQNFDLVVTDLHLGKFNGLNFIREATQDRNHGSQLKFVLTSDDQAPPANFHDLGGRIAFCPKPLTPQLFLNVVKKLVVVKVDAATGKTNYKIDVEFINPFIEATLKVFDSRVNIQPLKELIFIRHPNEPSGDISSVISIQSDFFWGSLAICFEEDCFLAVVSKMLGKKCFAVTEMNKNAAADICMEIFNGAKQILLDKGHHIQPATPKVIVGKGHRLNYAPDGVCIAVKFKTEVGGFTLESEIKNRA